MGSRNDAEHVQEEHCAGVVPNRVKDRLQVYSRRPQLRRYSANGHLDQVVTVSIDGLSVLQSERGLGPALMNHSLKPA